MAQRDEISEIARKMLARRDALIKTARNERQGVGEQLMTSPGDVADLSVSDTNTDYYLQLADADRRELREIDDALTRLRDGTYGICLNCENEIGIERLRHVPQARYCIDCQARFEVKFKMDHPTAGKL